MRLWEFILHHLSPNEQKKREKSRENKKKAFGLYFVYQGHVGQTNSNKNVSIVKWIKNRVPSPNFHSDTKFIPE